MASVQARTGARGTTYRLMYRKAGQPRSYTFTDQREAKRWAGIFSTVGADAGEQMLQAAVAAASPAAPPVPTVADLLARHIENLTGVTEGTRAEYRGDVRRDMAQQIGDLPITALTRDAVARWVNSLEARGMAAKTIRNRHGLLSAACAGAVLAGSLPSNPCKGMRLPTGTPVEMVLLEEDEFQVLLDHIPQRWHPLLITLVGSGLRWGEATALRVGDVDLKAGVLHVRRAWKHVRGGPHVIGPPKTHRSRRTVDLADQVLDVLQPLLAGRGRDELVFTAVRGGPVRNSSFHTLVWIPAMKRALAGGLPLRPRIHDLRHTYASWMLADGLPIHIVSAQMGHESIKTTVDRYGHLQRDAGRRAADAMTAALGRALPRRPGPAPAPAAQPAAGDPGPARAADRTALARKRALAAAAAA